MGYIPYTKVPFGNTLLGQDGGEHAEHQVSNSPYYNYMQLPCGVELRSGGLPNTALV